MATEPAGSLDVDALTNVAIRLQLIDGPDSFRSPAHQRELMRYLQELLASPEAVLSQQPARQQAAAVTARHQISELCAKHADKFVRVQASFDEMRSVLERADRRLGSLVDTHLPRLGQAAAAFEAEAPRALTTRQDASHRKEACASSILDVLSMSPHVRRYVSQGQYEQALQLLQDMVSVLPQAAATSHTPVRDDLFHTLAYTQRVLIQALCDEPMPLSQARHTATLLFRAISMARGAFADTDVDLRPFDVCYEFLRTRMQRVQASLSLEDMLKAMEAWHDSVHASCTWALSLWIEDVVPGSAVDPACYHLLGSFVTHAVDKLFTRLSAHVYTATHDLPGPARRWASAAEHLDALYTKLVALSDSLADMGAALELELLPYAGDVSSPLSAWDHGALSLWHTALAAIEWDRDGALPATHAPAPSAHAVPPSLKDFPQLFHGAVQLVAALNTLRCFAPHRIATYAIEALGTHLAQHVPTGEAPRTCFVHVLAPWAAAALVQGVWDDDRDAMAALCACPAWAEVHTMHTTRGRV
ncbi:hypothetical protein MNAN1_001137 [Malassezia nana]|uniref:Conserved oligomeric Golgi complex subunit 8 n=1 Tax=Malassezia nana TaxID=180528 RepID=A0AAF0ENU3_9BASI|nr:hypothetical protein MNAN1_001137 [Malassezia nana]